MFKATPLALALALAGLTAGLMGCGQTSYFAVDVTIAASISSGTLEQINSCEIMTSGAVSDETDFVLNQAVCSSNATYMGLDTDSNGDHVLGTFEYGTSKSSGQVSFTILLKDGSQKTLGMGQQNADIKAGTVVPVTLHVSNTDVLTGNN